MNLYDEAISDLYIVMHEITRDENDYDTMSIYEIIDKLKGVKQALERAKKEHEFIINTFIECDEFGMEPTIPTHENGQQIVTRWRKELEEMK